MRNLISSPYEISIWEDAPVTEYYNEEGKIIKPYQYNTIEEVGEHTIEQDGSHTFNEAGAPLSYASSLNYMEEQMVAIIGSNGMDSPIRAFEPCLQRNVNGTVTLTFYMYMRYYDDATGDFIWNPYINLMVNERKLKLKYKDDWYDLIIKDVEEDSEKYTMLITAMSLPIIELSKAGFNITLDAELKNNIGTITELGETILKDTDWKVKPVGEGGSDLLEETLEEALYELHIRQPISIENIRTGEIETIVIPEGKEYATAYAFYSSYQNVKKEIDDQLQIVYEENDLNYELDEDGVIIVSENPERNKQYFINNITYEYDAPSGEYVLKVNDVIISYDTEDESSDIWISYVHSRGEKLVHNTYQVYDPIVEKVCTIYESTDDSYTAKLIEKDENEEILPSLAILDRNKLRKKLYIGEHEIIKQDNIWYTNKEMETVATNLVLSKTQYGISFEYLSQEFPMWFTAEDIGKDVCIEFLGKTYSGTIEYYEPFDLYGAWIDYEEPLLVPYILFGTSSVGNEIVIFNLEPEIEEDSIVVDLIIKETESNKNSNFTLIPIHLEQYGITNINDKSKKLLISAHLETIYGYTEDDYSVTDVIRNFIGDGKSFVNTKEWASTAGDGTSSESVPAIQMSYFPDVAQQGYAGEEVHKYLCIPPENKLYQVNTTVQSQLETLKNGLIKGNKLVFKMRVGQTLPTTDSGGQLISYNPKNRPISINNLGITILLADYKTSGTNYILGTTYCEFCNNSSLQEISGSSNNPFENVDYDGQIENPTHEYFSIATIEKGLTQEQIKGKKREYDNGNWKLGIFIKFTNIPKNSYTYMESVELFDFQEVEIEGETKYRQIGSVPTSAPQILYSYFFYPAGGAIEKDDLIYLENSNTPYPLTTLTPKERQYPFEKVRMITGKESNRFNLLQSICETFECWLTYDIKRDKNTGKIKYIYEYEEYDEEGQGIGPPIDKHQDKWIVFKKYIGEHNYRGFYYGTNLKAIKRSIESEEIVTKMIVGQNSNEFGQGGLCTIQRSIYNPIKESFVLNFDYYIKQKMLNKIEFLLDLTTNYDGHLNYYSALSEIQKDNDDLIIEYDRLFIAQCDADSSYQSYQGLADKANEDVIESLEDIRVYLDQKPSVTEADLIKLIKEYVDGSKKETKTINKEKANYYYTKYVNNKYNSNTYSGLAKRVADQRAIIHSQLIEITDKINEIIKQKQELEYKFYKKYSRFIQEGSWIDESYYDDDLYYLDAQKVLYDSAYPQVTYTINVLDLNELFGYENYNYNLGDITYVEDTEFFGYIIKDGLETPYKEEVLISQTTDYLDSPEKNVITIQNFKTQFEDLFQRITATTQSLQYSSGAYDRTTSLLNLDGTVNEKMLSESLQNILATISNGFDKTTELGADGILTKNKDNAKEQTKFYNGAIYTSKDGGETWEQVLSPQGIKVSQLTAGKINTEEILIYSGEYPTFRWDNKNLIAYDYIHDDNPIDERAYAAFNFEGLQVAAYDSKDGTTKIRVKAGYLNDNDLQTYGFALYNNDYDRTLWADSENGNLHVEGEITANSGKIGKWNIDSIDSNNWYKGALYTGTIGSSGGIYLIPSGSAPEDKPVTIAGHPDTNWRITAGANFGITESGYVYAAAGNIGNWTIGNNSTKSEQNGSLYYGAFEDGIYLIPNGVSSSKEIAGETRSDWAFTIGQEFGVTKGGKLYCADGKFQGDIIVGNVPFSSITGGANNTKLYASDFNVTGGTVGGWTITENYIQSDESWSDSRVILCQNGSDGQAYLSIKGRAKFSIGGLNPTEGIFGADSISNKVYIGSPNFPGSVWTHEEGVGPHFVEDGLVRVYGKRSLSEDPEWSYGMSAGLLLGLDLMRDKIMLHFVNGLFIGYTIKP